MSLIPSESASFPDLLGRGLGASKKSKWREPHLLDQPAPSAPKIEAPSEPTTPAPVVEEISESIAAEATQLEPLSPDSATLEPVSEELPIPTAVDKPAEIPTSEPSLILPVSPPVAVVESTSEMPVLNPIEPVALPAAEVQSTSETAADAPGPANPPSTGNSELSQLAVLLAGSVNVQLPAPPQVPESSESSEPELAELEPLSPVETPPSAAIPEKIPDPPVTISQKVEAQLSSAATPQTEPIVETPARIPIRPIARSNVTAAKTEASAGTDVANTEPNAPVPSVVPPPRPPRAKPRLRPRPNLQPRFESGLDSIAFGDEIQPLPSPPLIPRAPEKPESVAYLDYLAPDISTRHEDFKSAKAVAEESPEVRQRKRNKFFWFVGCEIIVLALLVGAVLFGWSHRYGDGSLSPAARLGAVVAAIAVAVLPIIFYGLPKPVARDPR